MVALSGTRPFIGHLEAAFENYSADNDRATVSIASGVVTGPFNPIGQLDISADVGVVALAGSRGEILPLVNNIAIAQRHNIRGQDNTGRWNMIGKAPQDGMGIGFDYWEQCLIQPGVANLGNVVSDTILNVAIINTFRRDSQTLNSITNNAGAGITITGATPPANLAPLADKVYIVTVTTQGPPNINGTIDFLTTCGTLTLALSGTRIIIFPYPPQSDIQETLAWMTDVIRSADGTEQRNALRSFPRQSVVYEIASNSLFDLNNIRNLMVDWTTRVFGVPTWWYETSLRSNIAINDFTIFVRPGGLDNADFRIGGLAMIYQEDANGVRTIDTLQISDIIMSVASPESTQDTITFATAVQNNYDGDIATVVPVVAAILATPASQKTPIAGQTSRFDVNFDMVDNAPTIPGVDIAWYPELADFDGNVTLVINDRNFMSGRILSEKFEQKPQRVDFNIGKFQQLTQELRARRSTPFNWRVEDASFEWQVRSLLYNLRGKLRNAWLPTWRPDFAVNSNIGNGSSTIDVENWNFATFVTGTPWSGVRLQKTDGSISYHRITSVVEIDSITERLNIDPITSFAATVAEVELLDLMILARLATDDVTFQHHWTDAQSDDVDSTIETVFIGDVQ